MSQAVAFPGTADEADAPAERVRGYWGMVGLRLRHDYVTLGFAAVLIALALAAIFAPVLAPFDPYRESIIGRLKPFGWRGHPLGTDELGRDLLSRLLYGGRISLMMGVLPVTIATAIGGTLGVIGGFSGRMVNTAIMRTMDVFYAFPSILLAVAISGAMGGGIVNGMVALSLVFIPAMCRVAETATTQVRGLDYNRGGAGERRGQHHHHPLPRARQRAGPGLHLRVEPGQRQHPARLRAFIPRPRRAAAGAGLGADAEHAAAIDLCRSGGLRAAGHRDLRRVDLLQPGQRWDSRRDGRPDVSGAVQATTISSLDRGGAAQPLLIAKGLRKHFRAKGSGRGAQIRAVDEISFTLFKGETLGIVGESGCGKSTLARLLLHLITPDAGDLIFDGDAVGDPRGIDLPALRKQVQMVFQDSASSLNPRMPIQDSVAFGPMVNGRGKPEARKLAQDMLSRVGLNPALFGPRYPHELSGGQKQRVNIARALAIGPRMVILDEAVSALDKSVEAQVLNLLSRLKATLNLTYLFISHDLNVVRHVSDRVLVMYLGKVVELGPVAGIFADPKHPYTRALLACRPSMDPAHRIEEPPIVGDPPSPIDPPSGCRFRTRCGFAEEVCARREPPLGAWLARASHVTACHMEDPASGHSRAGVAGRA